MDKCQKYLNSLMDGSYQLMNESQKKEFDKLFMVATSPNAVSACQKAIDAVDSKHLPVLKLWTWLDL